MTKPFLRKSACGKTTLKERAEKWTSQYIQRTEGDYGRWDIEEAFMAGWKACRASFEDRIAELLVEEARKEAFGQRAGQ